MGERVAQYAQKVYTDIIPNWGDVYLFIQKVENGLEAKQIAGVTEHMNLKRLTNSFAGKLVLFAGIYLVLALVMYWIVADDWTRTAVETDTVTMSQLLPENAVVEQRFHTPMETLEVLTVTPHLSGAQAEGFFLMSVLEDDRVLLEQSVAIKGLTTDDQNEIRLEMPLDGVKGKMLTLKIDPQESGLALWAGNTMSAGKFDVAVSSQGLTVDGAEMDTSLVLKTQGSSRLAARGLFWPAALVLMVLILGAAVVVNRQMQQGKKSMLIILIDICGKYSFLLKQLVSRDFRVKYKASMLGVVWSFLNPLLTMLVYLFVFSTIFRSNIENFPVYLMSGIVLFNYFSEATSLGLTAIVGNSALITKVYMPKVIYPLSKVISSAINLCISFIPLLLVMIITGVPFHKSLLLLPVVVAFLLMFSFGMSLLLSAMNVFFRDTQFLWGVVLTMLNFLTPVFYPESIIPAQFQTIYHMNPMYQILFFMRSIVIGGVSPNPITYLYCLVATVVPLLLGLWIFRKNQDKFVLYL